MRKTIKVLTVATMLFLLCVGFSGMTSAGADNGDSTDQIFAKVYFKVSGMGSFQAGPYNTSSGAVCGWFEAGAPISLSAVAAPGWEFSYWTLNGNYAGNNPGMTAYARIGLEIKAVFKQK